MFPVVNIFGLEVQTYSIISAIGFALSALLAVHLGKKRSIPSEKILLMMIFSAAGLFLGGHLLFALTNIKAIATLSQSGELSLGSLKPYVGGMVFYGGLMGAALAMLIFSKIDKEVSKGDAFDVFAVSVPLFHAFGRVGCFFAGCCYGIESEFGFAFYTNTSPAHYGVSRFPVQLAEVLGNLLIFTLLVYFYKRNILKSRLFLIYLSIYAPMRFLLEFFRGDDIRGFVLSFSTSQLISVLIVLSIAVYLVINLCRKFTQKANRF